LREKYKISRADPRGSRVGEPPAHTTKWPVQEPVQGFDQQLNLF
jgi:hypothetical protein